LKPFERQLQLRFGAAAAAKIQQDGRLVHGMSFGGERESRQPQYKRR
jgi:hypothetical protein